MQILLFDDLININHFNSKNIKADKKTYKNILIYYYIRCEILDDLKSLYFNLNQVAWNIKDNNGNKYLTLIPVDESKEKI